MKRYALLAATAAVGGAIAFQGSVNLQATTPGSPQTGHLNITGTARAGVMVGYSNTPTGIAFGGDFRSASTSGRGVLGNASATSGATYGGLFQSFSNAGRGVAGIAQSSTGNTYGGFFSSLSVAGYGVYGQATATSGTTYGVYGLSNSSSGRGVYGLASASSGGAVGGFFQSNSEEGVGVLGINTSTIGSTSGVFGQSASVEGYGVYGKATNQGAFGVFSEGNMHATGVISGNGSGLTNLNAAMLSGRISLTGSSPDHVIHGVNQATSNGASGVTGVASGASGQVYGVHGWTTSTQGFGVFGVASATSGPNVGGWFESESTTGTGVVGTAKATSGVNYGGRFFTASQDGYAVYGVNTQTEFGGTGVYGAGGGSFAGYGVYGQATGLQAYGVYAQGPLGASGTKSFRIDHPHDPENKYLLHFSAESPAPQNFYLGNVVTDAKGYGWVELPDYFEDINTNFKYQLTVVDGKNTDDFVVAKVAIEIKDGRFLIRTSVPKTKVSWRVDADRNDLWVQRRQPKDVEDKVGPEKGRYQHPELYGLGPERGMSYLPERAKKPILPKK